MARWSAEGRENVLFSAHISCAREEGVGKRGCFSVFLIYFYNINIININININNIIKININILLFIILISNEYHRKYCSNYYTNFVIAFRPALFNKIIVATLFLSPKIGKYSQKFNERFKDNNTQR